MHYLILNEQAAKTLEELKKVIERLKRLPNLQGESKSAERWQHQMNVLCEKTFALVYRASFEMLPSKLVSPEILIKLISRQVVTDPMEGLQESALTENDIMRQNAKMLYGVKVLLEKSSSCFKELHNFDSSKSLLPLSFIFCMRLFEKARFNLCQAGYNASQIFDLLNHRVERERSSKLTRRRQEFETGNIQGKEGHISACLKSVQFSLYGDKVNKNFKSSYE